VSKVPRIWVLLGHRRGDNNQLLALAEGLGVPFETRTLAYRWTLRGHLKLWRSTIGHLTPASRRWLGPPWPDLVIGIGQRSVPVARWIRNCSGGHSRLVRLGHPRAPNRLFDLVITTRQYPVPPGDNVVTLPLAMNRFRAPPKPLADESAWLEARPRPHLLLSLGGTAPMWQLDIPALSEAAGKLAERAATAGGTLIVVGSPRTPTEAYDVIRKAVGKSPNVAIIEQEVRYPVLLADGDEHFVTADSVSMISEAIVTGKPVGLIPIEPDALGQRRLTPDPDDHHRRDPRRFWAEVESKGLVGTVDSPSRGDFEDPVETAVGAIQRTLGSLFE
jgi:mitochondrial fission protein ELM1